MALIWVGGSVSLSANLSILFLRFEHLGATSSSQYIHTFNSLFEIQGLGKPYLRPPKDVIFQFSFWDSELLRNLSQHVLTDFQFSFWDSETRPAPYYHTSEELSILFLRFTLTLRGSLTPRRYFQFSFWDSRFQPGSILLRILSQLSILFLRFFGD